MLALSGWFWLAIIVLQPLWLLLLTVLVSLWQHSKGVNSGQGY